MPAPPDWGAGGSSLHFPEGLASGGPPGRASRQPGCLLAERTVPVACYRGFRVGALAAAVAVAAVLLSGDSARARCRRRPQRRAETMKIAFILQIGILNQRRGPGRLLLQFLQMCPVFPQTVHKKSCSPWANQHQSGLAWWLHCRPKVHSFIL